MNNNENPKVAVTQKARLMNYFRTGMKITSLEALTELGIYRLSARLSELESSGIPISREGTKVVNRYGEEVYIKRYWIEPYRKAVELKTIINKQPMFRTIFNSLTYDKAEQAKVELDELIKNNSFLFGELK